MRMISPGIKAKFGRIIHTSNIYFFQVINPLPPKPSLRPAHKRNTRDGHDSFKSWQLSIVMPKGKLRDGPRDIKMWLARRAGPR